MNFKPQLSRLNRPQAFLLHLCASAIVLFAFYLFVSQILYPQALFWGVDGWSMFKILIPVDLILGPLLMLLIFKPNKPKLKFDVYCVLLFQVVFFIYGAWVIYSARPVYITLMDDHFYVSTANQIEAKDLALASDEHFQTLPKLQPNWVTQRSYLSQEERNQLSIIRQKGEPIGFYPQFLTALNKSKPLLPKQAKSLDQMLSISAEDKLKLSTYVADHKEIGIVFMPLYSKTSLMYVAINQKTAEILRIL